MENHDPMAALPEEMRGIVELLPEYNADPYFDDDDVWVFFDFDSQSGITVHYRPKEDRRFLLTWTTYVYSEHVWDEQDLCEIDTPEQVVEAIKNHKEQLPGNAGAAVKTMTVTYTLFERDLVAIQRYLGLTELPEPRVVADFINQLVSTTLMPHKDTEESEDDK